MSVINLETAKQYLDVIHTADDDKLQRLLDAAEDEALRFLDVDSFADICCESSSEVVLPPSVESAVLVLLQANYQASSSDALELRRVAEIKLMPYRRRLGV